MGYITVEYYKTTFLGTDPGDDTELARLIERASDMVDIMTDSKSKCFDDLQDFQQEAIEKATAYQTEYMVENGDTFSDTPATSEKVGTWSIGGAGGASGQQMFSKVGMAYLDQNNLANAIIGVGAPIETDIL